MDAHRRSGSADISRSRETRSLSGLPGDEDAVPAEGWRRRSKVATSATGGLRRSRVLALTVTALVGFGLLAWGAAVGVTQGLDETLMRWLDARASEGLTTVALALTDLGDWQVAAAMGLVASALLWVHGQRKAALLLWVALAGTLLLDDTFKDLFGRDRPTVFDFRTQFSPTSKSFPSGHAMNATVAYTFIAYLVARTAESRVLRVLTRLFAGLLVLGVAFSRVYLGVHFPTDVVGGFLVGSAWVLLCILALRGLEGFDPS